MVPGPGHGKQDRSLSILFDPALPDGFLATSFAGDDWTACRDYIKERLGLGRGGTIRAEPRKASTAVSDEERTARALALWSAAQSFEKTPAEAYLGSRGLSYSGAALRWHPSCPFGKERVGCMLALVRNIVTNQAQAIHRAAIDASGRKLSHLGSNGRLSFGPVSGGAIKLSADDEVTLALGIGEGIHTTLSLRTMADLDALPVWSLVSAGQFKRLPVLDGIEALWIAADHDPGGIAGARAAARTWLKADREVLILAPSRRSADLNDIVEEARHGAA